MKKTQNSQALSIEFWREKDILDFLGVLLLFTACLTISAFQH